ncbi:PLAC8 family-domain-containing protein [Gigaspora rosea]|uniref:PLAC8 family-domain-containing protein n=1 Tax=Gigaspora rosea TaxID=44941 RepID=A0A397W4K1_9GLOM|nr:PLAC8 family-domain-containing protein [Gigaspora rosea]
MTTTGTPQVTTAGAQFVQENTGVPGQPRQWKYGLCDCFSDCGLCLVTWFVPCVTYGQTKAKLNNDDSCFSNGFLYCCSMYLGANWILGGMTRGDIRARNNIEGSCFGDYCTHCCCPLCALVQENREVQES